MAHPKIPTGYRFRPTDMELLGFLALFVTGSLSLSWYPMKEKNLYSGEEPWQLFGNSKERIRYYFTPLKKKNPRNSRYRRTIGDGKGTWKAQDKGKPIFKSGRIMGYKRSLRYENKGSEHDGQWLMKEYYLPDTVRKNLKVPLKDIVLCRIKRKQNWDSKNHESESTTTNDIRDIIGDLSTPATPEPSESETTTLTLLAL
ncbi:PREDICTED: NAC domain-containing protein 55-like isoform X1 [Ipomoea nil]|uniref:NAC domain-containing protein 55-like isoform X1 n=1 Tax=Ipomoea nil TaxID=35883 RepID=UPI000901E794|nr:PREDICTED: NAC domain-containing protein 55-like isoform X1 [Ipomoea nil]